MVFGFHPLDTATLEQSNVKACFVSECPESSDLLVQTGAGELSIVHIKQFDMHHETFDLDSVKLEQG